MSDQTHLLEVEGEAERTFRIQRLVTKQELSKILSVSERLIELEMAAGRIPYLKVGRRAVRFDVPDVLESLRRHE